MMQRSSCLRRSRVESEASAASNGATAGKSPSPHKASVTIVSRESLPTYSSERFFLLSEIEEYAAKPVFYLETDAADESTVETKEDSLLDSGHQQPNSNHRLAQFLILYVLWQQERQNPDTTEDEDMYVRTVLVPFVDQLEQYVSLAVPEDSNIPVATSPSGVHETKSEAEDNSSNTNGLLPTAHVYLVVERVVQRHDEGDQKNTKGDQESNNDADTRLTQAIASHPRLRNTLLGVTVATANHTRAAPGIEAMYQAIAITGARDRRRHSAAEGNNIASKKSLLQVVTPSLSHLVPSAQADSPDAAENVQQTRVAAEWNGRGTLETFAQTAHSVWRQRNGITTNTTTLHRKVPRRWVKQHHQQQAMAYITAETVYDVAAVIMVVAYAMYHLW